MKHFYKNCDVFTFRYEKLEKELREEEEQLPQPFGAKASEMAKISKKEKKSKKGEKEKKKHKKKVSC